MSLFTSLLPANLPLYHRKVFQYTGHNTGLGGGGGGRGSIMTVYFHGELVLVGRGVVSGALFGGPPLPWKALVSALTKFVPLECN